MKFRIDKTIDILDKEDKEALEQHKTSIASTALTVNTLKEGIEEKKFTKGESEDNIKEWGAETEAMLSSADDCTRRIEKKLSEIDLAVQEANALQANKLKLEFEKLSTEQQLRQQQEAAEYAHAQQLDFEKEKRKLELEYQQQLHRIEINQKSDSLSAPFEVDVLAHVASRISSSPSIRHPG